MRGMIAGLIIYSFLVLTAQAQTLVGSFPSPRGSPRGLAWDGEYLWCADAEADSVYQLNPHTGEVVSGFSFNILHWFGGITWSDDANVWIANGSHIYKVNPSTGEVVDSCSCPGG